MKTKLFYGLPAVNNGKYWIVISPFFDELLRIPNDRIDSSDVYEELKQKGYFISRSEELPDVKLVTLITTSDCNLRCGYCFANSGEKKVTMDERMAFAAIRHALKEISGKKLSIAFFGGEPTLTKDFIKKVVKYSQEIIKDTQASGVEFSITTNGVISASFIDYLIDKNFKITLSVDGSPDIQDFQRPLKDGGKSSPFVDRTIKHLISQNKNFRVRATVTDYSVMHMVEMVDWLCALGGKEIHYEPLSIAGRASLQTRGISMQRPDFSVFAEQLKASILRGAELDIGVINSSFMNLIDPPKNFCEGNSNNRFAVSYTGDITTCVEVQDKCHPVFPEFILGKYNNDKDEIILEKKERQRACGSIIKLASCQCADCFAKRICGGGCPVRNYHTTGDSMTVDPYRCNLIKEMLPFIMDLFDKASI